MKIKNESLLDRFRGPGFCELCKKVCQARVPHHVFERGMGGGRRLDVGLNLVSVGASFCCPCHDKFHSHQIARAEFLAAVARRVGSTVADVEATLRWLIGLPRAATDRQLAAAMAQLTQEQARLAELALREGSRG